MLANYNDKWSSNLHIQIKQLVTNNDQLRSSSKNLVKLICKNSDSIDYKYLNIVLDEIVNHVNKGIATTKHVIPLIHHISLLLHNQTTICNCTITKSQEIKNKVILILLHKNSFYMYDNFAKQIKLIFVKSYVNSILQYKYNLKQNQDKIKKLLLDYENIYNIIKKNCTNISSNILIAHKVNDSYIHELYQKIK